MIGLHDYITNPRNGRPEPHQTWLGERFITRIGWAMATISFVGATFYYAKWQEADRAVLMLVGGLVLGGIAWLRGRALNRKRAALLRATAAYETMLHEPLP